MELKKVTSNYEMNRNNFLLYIFYLVTKLGFAYLTIQKFNKIFFWIFSKIKELKVSKYSFLFADAIFLVINFGEIFLYYYIMNLISFYNLRIIIFEYVNFNFTTNSNIRELDSFKIFYCMENTNFSKVFNENYDSLSKYNIDEGIDDIYNAKNSNSNDETFKLESLKTHLCFLNNFLDGFYIEYFILTLILGNMIYKNIKIYFNENYQGFSLIYKIFFIIFAIMQIIYFSILYVQLSKIKSDISKEKIIHSYSNDKLNSEIEYHNYKSDENNIQGNFEEYNSLNNNFEDNEYERELADKQIEISNSQSSSIWNIIGEILGFIIEVLAD